MHEPHNPCQAKRPGIRSRPFCATTSSIGSKIGVRREVHHAHSARRVKWWAEPDSNRRPSSYELPALSH